MQWLVAASFGLASLLAWTADADPADLKSQAKDDLPPAAVRFVVALAKEDFVAAVERFDATMKQAMPESKLRAAWHSLTDQAGAFKQRLGSRKMSRGPYEVVFVTCEFARAVVDVKVVFNSDGRIGGLWFVPGQRPTPETALPTIAPETVREKEVSIAGDKWILPGTLTLPATGAGPWPAVVLVHGSGPNDRDETVGVTKPFRDLAWGLAAKGMAALRYEKSTKAHPEKFLALRGFTVKEETIDDALSAVTWLRAMPGITAQRIFVVGHSLGGTVAPRIGQADPAIAGLIILAGSTRSLEDMMLEQTRYLLSLDGGLSSEDNAKLAQLESDVAKVKQATDPAATGMVLGAPAAYWIDLRRYDATATARDLKQPLLILQGGRDYQVTQADFDGWKKALASRPNTTFKSYPKLNHLFVAGEGKSTPNEYEQPGRVSGEVVNDIAAWISQW